MYSTGEKIVFFATGLTMSAVVVWVAQTFIVPKGVWSALAVLGLFLLVSFIPTAVVRIWRWVFKQPWHPLVVYFFAVCLYVICVFTLAAVIADLPGFNNVADAFYGR